MSTDLHQITLESLNRALVATNDRGHLVLPILCLDREPLPEDAEGWEQVLVFVDGKERDITGDITSGKTTMKKIVLDADNNYTHTVDIETEAEWNVVGVNTSWIQVTPASGASSTTIEIRKASSLTATGNYQTAFAVLDPTDEIIAVILVTVIVSVPLAVRHNNTTARNGETLTVTLTAPNYSPQYLYITRDQAWILEGVDTTKITVSPMSGNGAGQWDSEVVSIAKAAGFNPTALTTTTFWVVSLTQRVQIIVNITPPITGEFVDPRPGEVGVTGQSDIYIYI